MVRTAQFCTHLGRPWVLDLDDLLSERYTQLADAPASPTLLGYFAARLPTWLHKAATRGAQSLLRTEARRITTRELYFGHKANAVTLVSAVEAGKLSGRLGRVVYDTAVGIDDSGASQKSHASRKKTAVLFVGGLDYQPNLNAVRYYLEYIAPALQLLGCEVALHIAGNAPIALRPSAPSQRLHYLGYVDDVAATMQQYSIFVAPILANGGVKTKVLEAMANNMAIVATEQAVGGLNVTHGKECYVANTPASFAQAIQRFSQDTDACAQLARGAKTFVQTHYAHSVLRDKWKLLLKEAVDNYQMKESSRDSDRTSDASG